MLASVVTKGGFDGGNNGGVGIGTNELPDALTWMILELRFFTKDWSTTGFLYYPVYNLLGERETLFIPQEFSFL